MLWRRVEEHGVSAAGVLHYLDVVYGMSSDRLEDRESSFGGHNSDIDAVGDLHAMDTAWADQGGYAAWTVPIKTSKMCELPD